MNVLHVQPWSGPRGRGSAWAISLHHLADYGDDRAGRKADCHRGWFRNGDEKSL